MSALIRFFTEEDGQDMVEYGLVVSLIVVGGIVAYQAFSTQINTGIDAVADAVSGNL